MLTFDIIITNGYDYWGIKTTNTNMIGKNIRTLN